MQGSYRFLQFVTGTGVDHDVISPLEARRTVQLGRQQALNPRPGFTVPDHETSLLNIL